VSDIREPVARFKIAGAVCGSPGVMEENLAECDDHEERYRSHPSICAIHQYCHQPLQSSIKL
jgi:hypothetical protein